MNKRYLRGNVCKKADSSKMESFSEVYVLSRQLDAHIKLAEPSLENGKVDSDK